MKRLVNVRVQTLRAAAVIAAVVVLGSGPDPAWADNTTPGVYVKQDTWTGTMLASRAAYLRWQDENAGPAAADAKPFVSDPIAGDGPGQQVSVNVSGCRWLRLQAVLERGGGNCHIWGGARLIAKDGTETRLSSLQPVSVTVGWGELLRDKNWQNHTLKIGDREFEHGIWVHANSDVCYKIDGKYERFEAWVGMDADRATGIARFKVLFTGADLPPAIWRQIAADFPAQAGWFHEDTGRHELDWFLDGKSSRTEQAVIGRVLGQLGPLGAAFGGQLNELKQAKAPADDPRWLDLYQRACRLRECKEPLDRIWIAELRRQLEDRFAPLLQADASPDDDRWAELKSWTGRVAAALPPAQPIDTASMRASIGNLAEALPGRFTGGDRLLAKLDEQERRWPQVLAAVARGDEKSLGELPAVADQMRGLRHWLLLAMRGMPEFLAKPADADMEQEWANQFETLKYDLRNNGHFAKVAPEAFRPESLIQEADRDPADVVLRRAAALLADLKRTSAAPQLAGLEQELAELRAANAKIALEHAEARYALFADACRVRREIALANPLLSFDDLVFIKRHRALFNHMCDQYYGMAATPGGGLYVLEGAFGPHPSVRDVLADSVVEGGRLAGEKLDGGPTTTAPVRFDGQGNRHGDDGRGGSFLSPDLSYDGRRITFAYVECEGDTNHRHHTDATQGHWAEGRCFHVFKVNVDGSGLVQLTDGTWNDFDPCWLPNGRIAFISERRGGYLRCGRVCPTYTLFDMAADGSDIACLSFHETNEWHPSVTSDGLIVWTRWDYVDRHGCTAHMPWLTTLDGRDPRPIHGNYAPRNARPDMEVDCRSIPDSPKLVATAAPHHGQAYGSLVIVDPNVPDDDAMGPVRRITPEVGFPESQGGAQVYGTAWPLSEDYYLCVYDAAMQPGVGRQGGAFVPGNYGIYLVDSFGNKELIYRDPEIACLSPIPLRPRSMPVAAPEVARGGPETNPATRPPEPDGAEPEGTIAVVNVYDSLKPWPEGTEITQLRVLQVLPMSVPSGGPPHDTGLRVASAGDSVVPCRWVLGTVPVEADGSAHFTVPANRELFFQALDQRGLAVQSMRSATHVRRGERLVCAGCHEPKTRVAASLDVLPLALERAPSRLVPDVDGSNPFSYPRLVQPVLDRKCVECHAKHEEAINLAREPIQRNWFASYNNLVGKFAFTNYGDSYRTTPGKFGAKASKLYDILQQGHYDVKLTDEELHRLTLWLDCTSMFYGVYEREGGQAQLRGEIARPTLE